MTARAFRSLVGAALLLLAVVAGGGSAVAQDVVTLQATDEGWYQPNPTCATVTGCVDTSVPGVDSPTTSPYPEETLHVGVLQGMENARTYLTFDVEEGRIPTAAILEIPIDDLAGTALPDMSKVVVCTFFGSITEEDGSFEQAPTAACEVNVEAEHDAELGLLRADLEPLLFDLAFGSGLVLLPNAAEAAATDNWHVAFSSAEREEAPTPPATLVLTYADAEPAVTPTPTSTPTPQPTAEETPTPAPANPIAPVAPPPATTSRPIALPPPVRVPAAAPTPAPIETPEVAEPVVAPSSDEAVATPQLVERVITTPYAYPGAVRLPVVLVLLLFLAGRALTGELQPRNRPRPA